MPSTTQEGCSRTPVAKDFSGGTPTLSVPPCLGISERKRNCGAMPPVMRCGHSGKYRWPPGWRPHRKGDSGLDLLSSDKHPWSSPERKPSCRGTLCVCVCVCVCVCDRRVWNGQVLIETVIQKQETNRLVEGWPWGAREHPVLVKGPRFFLQGVQ